MTFGSVNDVCTRGGGGQGGVGGGSEGEDG